MKIRDEAAELPIDIDELLGRSEARISAEADHIHRMTDVFDPSSEPFAGPTGKLTESDRAALAAVAAMPDDEIDLRGESEVKDWSGAVRSWLCKLKIGTSPKGEAP